MAQKPVVLLTKYGCVPLQVEFLYGSNIAALQKGVSFVEKGKRVNYTGGALLVPRRTDAGISYAFYGTIYEAIRSREHALNGYLKPVKGEKAALRRADKSLSGITEALYNTREFAPEELVNIARRIERLTEKFAYVRNQKKREALSRFTQSKGVRDSLKRRNPIATSNRLLPAKRLIAERLMEIDRIAPRVGIQLLTLYLELERSLAVCRRAILTLAVMLKNPLFNRKEIFQQAGVISRIELLEKELSVLRAEPFCSLSINLSLELLVAQDCLKAGSFKLAAQSIFDAKKTLEREVTRAKLETALTDAEGLLEKLFDLAR